MRKAISKILVEVKNANDQVFYLMISEDGIWHRRGDRLVGSNNSSLVICADGCRTLFDRVYAAFDPNWLLRAGTYGLNTPGRELWSTTFAFADSREQEIVLQFKSASPADLAPIDLLNFAELLIQLTQEPYEKAQQKKTQEEKDW